MADLKTAQTFNSASQFLMNRFLTYSLTIFQDEGFQTWRLVFQNTTPPKLQYPFV